MVGSDARMRVSSSTRPSARGTLKSTRTKTRLPCRSRSRIDSVIARLKPRAALNALRDELAQQVDAAVRVAPLVVVPGEDLHEVAVHHLRVRRVAGGGRRVPLEVDRG